MEPQPENWEKRSSGVWRNIIRNGLSVMSISTTTCKRCGKCCLTNFIAYVTEEDLSRWRRENRQDILSIIDQDHLIWVGDHMISADDGHYAMGCPFLVPEQNHWSCSIYETRPGVCRNYEPGSSELCAQWNSLKSIADKKKLSNADF